MAITMVNPYLFYNGTAAKALELYKKALADTFWGARFGTLTDAFGVQWMFNCELKK